MSGQWKPRKRARVLPGRGAGWLNVLQQIARHNSLAQQRRSQASSSTRVSGAGRGGSQTTTGTSRSTARAARGRRGGSGTITRRRKYTKDAGNTADYSKVTSNYGKAQPYVKKQLSIVNSNTEKTVWVFRAINKAWGQLGFHSLNCNQPGGVLTSLFAPLHIYDLTCVPNANGTTATAQTVGYHLGFTNETTTASALWTPLTNNVTGSTQWIAMTSPNPNPERMEGGQSYLDWVNVKLLLYAQTQFPTKVKIDLVQFTRDTLVPSPDAGTSTVEADAFWQSLTHPYMWNPIHPVNGNYKKYLKVLKTVVVEMDARESDENAPTRYKEVNMFLKLGRKLNYRWLENDLASFTGVNSNPAGTIEAQINTAANQSRVHPRRRLFLMIRSVSPLLFPNGVASAANTVTYDISMTKKHLNLAPNF